MIMKVGKLDKIKKPIVIAGFIGFGNVGKITVEYLIDTLEPKEVLEIYSDVMPHMVFAEENSIAELPKIEFFHLKKGKRNFLFITSDFQPSDETKSYKFSEIIFQELLKVKAKEIVTAGGYSVDFEVEPPRVYGVGTDEKILKKFEKFGVTKSPSVRVFGAAGLLVGFSKIHNIPSIALLAETLYLPYYLGLKGAREIIKVLKKAYNFRISLKNLEKEIKEYQEMLARREEEEEIRKFMETIETKKKLRYFR